MPKFVVFYPKVAGPGLSVSRMPDDFLFSTTDISEAFLVSGGTSNDEVQRLVFGANSRLLTKITAQRCLRWLERVLRKSSRCLFPCRFCTCLTGLGKATCRSSYEICTAKAKTIGFLIIIFTLSPSNPIYV